MKTCVSCTLTLDESSFPPDSKGGLKAKCRNCINTYARNLYLKHHPPKPPPTPQQLEAKRILENAKRNAWRHRKFGSKPLQQYLSDLNATKALRASEKAKSSEQKIQLFAQFIREKWGQTLADLYLSDPWTPDSPSNDMSPRLQKLKSQVVASVAGLKYVSWAMLQRVVQLNKTCSLPLLNVGWHCASCGLFHTHPSFFDLDHVVPKCDHGEDEFHNIQCLCPNCHRKKSKGIDGVKHNHQFQSTPVQLVGI